MSDATDAAEPFRVLFVCTGNTCRSPLAEAVARRGLAARGWTHVEVASAGVATMDGLPASEGAQRVAEERGLDLSGHRSTRLTGRGVAAADLILTMSSGHLARVEELGGKDRAHLLTAFARESGGNTDPGPDEIPRGERAAPSGAGVPDPFGGSDEVYRETLAVLEELVDATLRRLERRLAG